MLSVIELPCPNALPITSRIMLCTLLQHLRNTFRLVGIFQVSGSGLGFNVLGSRFRVLGFVKCWLFLPP